LNFNRETPVGAVLAILCKPRLATVDPDKDPIPWRIGLDAVWV